ncbi:uncharacterized protein LOC18041576 isoform X3 [Citrus clementina]|nr:uncharacterized protein LOC18041576 isoform X3 [Citrus x clementina]
MLPQLNFLKMKDLAKLTRFCSGNCIELPSLKQLQIVKCPELKAFILQNISTDMTAVGIQPFFNKMVALPSLEEMVLSNMGNLKTIWHSQFAGESFCKLKLMEVKFCKSLRTIFPHNMFARFLKLESLIVGACRSLEEIFDLQEVNSEETHSGAATQLRELHVFHLPKLTKLWNKDPQGKLIFRNLVVVRIFDCQSLKNIFPTSIARSLLRLETLSIKDCGSVEEIVANDGRGNDAATKFIFPSLTFLRLRDLPDLTTFYSGMHILECPELRKLEVNHVDVFTSEYIQEGQLDFPAQEPLFWFEKLCLIGQQVFANLEELTLSKCIFTTWRQAQFHKLKILHFISDGSDFFQVGLLQNIHNLEKLVLSTCEYKKIFSCEEVEEHAEGIAQIKSLKLKKLWLIEEHLWNPDSKLDSFLQNLEFLEVKKCALSLISLVPSSASFRNLTVLKVCNCWQLISLVTPQTAKTLVQLRELRVSECNRLEEIVANDGDADDEIVFSKLKWLFLESSESITSFCSGNYAFSFPSLEDLIVENCPKLNTFSAGVLKTPRLQAVQNWELGEDFWAG